MMHLFASGELVKAPEQRTTREGKPYATALMRAGEDLVNLVAFDAELVERLLALEKGDPLSISGKLQVSTYTAKDGESRCSLSVTISRLMTAPARVSEARPRTKPKPGVLNRPPGPTPPTEGELDDEIGF
jgi:single-stranded DNA-binding protein